MADNYAKIVRDNHTRLMEQIPPDLAALFPAQKHGKTYTFNAFGGVCKLDQSGFYLDDEIQESVIGILLSLYALNAKSDACVLEPFKAYKEFPGTMPYVGAFTTHTENALVPHVQKIKQTLELIASSINGYIPENPESGDFSFIVYPLPKLALCYIFYEEDEDFPPSVKCLYSNNASLFVPNDALADVGEYTSKKIISIIK